MPNDFKVFGDVIKFFYLFNVHRSCPPIFVTSGFELKLEGFDNPSQFIDVDKAQICLNLLKLAGLQDGRLLR